MKQPNSTRFPAVALLAAVLAGSVGCQSGGGSKWAWNPFSRSNDAESMAELEPELPTADATPLIEGADPPSTQVASTEPTEPKTPTATQAVASVTPKIESAATSAPNWSPYPSTDAAAEPPTAPATTAIAKAPTAPTTPPSASLAATGAYDPNGYRPKPAPAAVASNDRYGNPGANRYQQTPLPEDFGLGDLPPLAPPSAPPATDRYAGGSPATPPAATTPSPTPPSAGGYPSTVASTYPLAAPGSATPGLANSTPLSGEPPVESIPAPPTPPLPPQVATNYPATGAPSVAPAYPTAGLSTGTSYPAASGVPPTTPAPSSTPAPAAGLATIGSIPAPPAASDAAEQAASAITQTAGREEPESVVRVTTVPGEYRPGGTSTYRSDNGVTRYR